MAVSSYFLLLLPLIMAQGQGNPYNVQDLHQGSTGISATLVLNDEFRGYGNPISPLLLEINYYNADTVQIRITDKNNARWEPPIELDGEDLSSNPNYKVEI